MYFKNHANYHGGNGAYLYLSNMSHFILVLFLPYDVLNEGYTILELEHIILTVK